MEENIDKNILETQENSSDATSEKKPVSVFTSQKFKGAFLVFIGLGILFCIGIFLWVRMNRAQPIANFLPADTTVALVEVTIDENSSQFQNFYPLFRKYDASQAKTLLQHVHDIFPTDYEMELRPWLGRKIGIAAVDDKVRDGALKLFLFVEMKDRTMALSFLQHSAQTRMNSDSEPVHETYHGFPVYLFADPRLSGKVDLQVREDQKVFSSEAKQPSQVSSQVYYTFFDDYLVIGGNKNLIHQLIDAQSGKNKLRDDPNYRKIVNNLPANPLIFAYTHMPKLFGTLLEHPAFEETKGDALMQLQPFLKIFSATGISIFADENQLRMQIFSSIDPAQVKNMPLVFRDTYQGKLLNLSGENPVLLVGGHDFFMEFDFLEKLFQSDSQASAFLFTQTVEELKGKFLGQEISIANDLEPLLHGEYLLEVDQSFQDPKFTFYFELQDKKDKTIDITRFEKIIGAFSSNSGIFYPQTQEFTLPDGTKGEEIVAGIVKNTQTTQEYNGTVITSLQLGKLPWGLHYAFLDRALVIGTDIQNVQKSVDRSTGKLQTRLTNTELYQQDFSPLLRTADEVFHVKIGALTAALGIDQNPDLKAYFDPLLNFSMTRNYFDDGISTTCILDVL